MNGLVHIYTGNGKGKTTAAVGLGVRAWGNGMKVLFVQFLKGSPTGEMKVFDQLKPNFTFYRGKQVKGFIWNMTEEQKEELKQVTREDFEFAREQALSDAYDVLILDEVMASISNKLIQVEDVVDLIRNKPQKLEIIITGRNAPGELVQLADYVSEISAVKHPFEKGIPARKGIEF